jgi:hypothetical protein
MFLRRIERRKNGKTHLYWSVVENKRLDGGGVVQRHVLYLGEINSSQAETWRKAVAVFDTDAGGPGRWPCSPRIVARWCRRTTPRWCSCACPIFACIVRGNGGLLVGRAVVARPATRSVLGRALAGEPEANALGSGSAGPGHLHDLT